MAIAFLVFQSQYTNSYWIDRLLFATMCTLTAVAARNEPYAPLGVWSAR